jgi:UDP-N-acetylmuramoyl-L-alanyl-D-glutamate--2,6-diaminopimelate ligase
VAICDVLVVGVRRAGAPGRFATEPDRAGAIRAALAWAEAGDSVVIAGKGHETYQIVGADVLAFDDREVARRILSGQRT